MEFEKQYESMQTEIVPSADLVYRTIAAASPKPNHHPLHIRTVILTAVLLVLLTCVFSFMVFAEKIPFLSNILDYLKQNRFPQSDAVTHGAVELYMESSPELETAADFRITETYCDGTVLVVSIAAEAEVTEEAVQISPIYNIAINDTFILDDTGNRKAFSDAYTNLYRTDGDLFLGSLAIDISDIDTSEHFTLTVDPIEAIAVNPYLQVQPADAQPGQYVPKSYILESKWKPYTVPVNINAGIRSEYPIEQSIENFTLHKVITTPGFTYFDITQPDGQANGYYFTVTDQNGNELQLMPHFAVHTNRWYYEPVSENVTAVLLSVYHWHDASNPIGTISVPIAGGYSVLNRPAQFADHREVIYDPPLEDESSIRLPRNFFSPQKTERIVPLGETLTTMIDQPRDLITGFVLNPLAYAQIKFSNMQVYDKPADAGIVEEDMLLTAPHENLSAQSAEYKFVTIDIHIENHGLTGSQQEEYQKEIQAYTNNDESASSFHISTYVSAVSNRFEDGIYDPEYAYFSHHMNGPTNYNHFIMNAFDSREFTVGFFVDCRLLESGEWYTYTKVSRTEVGIGQYARQKQVFYAMPAYTEESP